MDLTVIAKNYADRSDAGLRLLLGELDTLRKDAIPVLRDEFQRRNDIESVERIDSFLNKKDDEVYTEAEAQKFLDEKLGEGVPVDEIKQELAERGINIFNIMEVDQADEEAAYQALERNKKAGKNTAESLELIDADFIITEEKKEELSKKVKRRGIFNVILGSLLILSAVFSFFARLYLGQVSVTSAIFLVMGIWRLNEGVKQLK